MQSLSAKRGHLVVFALLVGLAVWFIADLFRPPVTVSVLKGEAIKGFVELRYEGGTAGARVHVSNKGHVPISIWHDGATLIYTVTIGEGPDRRQITRRAMCAATVRRQTLEPGAGYQFFAEVPEQFPFRIEVAYQTQGIKQKLRARLPRWLARRCQWLLHEPVAASVVCDASLLKAD